MFKMLKNQKGMTLVELLAVMVIIGIIAAISVPAIGSLIENSRKDATVSTATSLVEAVRMSIAADGLDVGTHTFTASDLVTKGYLETVPKNPSTKQPYGVAQVVVEIGVGGSTTYTISLKESSDKIGKYGLDEVPLENLERNAVNMS